MQQSACLGAGGKSCFDGMGQERRKVLPQLLSNAAKHAVGELPEFAIIYLQALHHTEKAQARYLSAWQ